MNSSHRVYLIRGVFIPLLISFLGCTNNLSLNTSNLGSLINTAPPGSGTSDGTVGTFTLSRVVKDTLNPTRTLNLVGDGSGTFGGLCQEMGNATNSSSSSSDSNTVCECSYKYSSSTHPNQHVFSAVTYHEQDLLRCSYASIPSDVTSVAVSVHLKSADAYSNAVTFNLTATGNSIDVTNPNSFVRPIRYQCRDVVNIPFLFDSSLYDPFQSEDIHLSYPIDFYTSNIAESIAAYVNSGQTYWNCPPILNPVETLTADALSTFYSRNHINLNIYSVVAQSGGGKSIYPPDGAIDRSTFYLAKEAVGVFGVPVNATMAPGVITAQGSTSSPPLGYGANPVPVGGAGSQQETCDSSVSIPVGYHWMKLWQFRAGLAQRHYATSGSGSSASISQVGAITCNPGTWPAGGSVYLQCGAAGYSLKNIDSTHYLANRVLSSGQCVKFDDGSGSFCGTHPGAGCNAGADQWMYDSGGSAGYGCSASPIVDPLNVCTNTASTQFTPINFNVGTGDLDAPSTNNADAAARYDYLFVVTPPSVNTADMLNTSPSSSSLAYTPYRFLTDQDCYSPDPDLAGPGDCLQSNAITQYGLRLVDVGSNGDPAGDTTSRTGAFPVCVLQPDPI